MRQAWRSPMFLPEWPSATSTRPSAGTRSSLGDRLTPSRWPGSPSGTPPGGVVQLVLDEQRAGGSLVTIWVPDARSALAGLASRGGPEVELDDTSSDVVLFASLTDPDGNSVTVVEVREGVTL